MKETKGVLKCPSAGEEPTKETKVWVGVRCGQARGGASFSSEGPCVPVGEVQRWVPAGEEAAPSSRYAV